MSDVTIEVCERLGDRSPNGGEIYHAQLKGGGAFGTGESPDEAIGNFVRCNPELLGLSISSLKPQHR